MSAKEILKASEDFFSIHKSPTCSNLLKTCSSPTEIVKDSQSTHPLVSPKTLQLIKDYLEIQKSTLSPADFIKRVLLKRPLMFCGSNDSTITRDYQRASHLDWAHIGTSISSLSIQDYLSYDEMCISALIGVSSFTRFINSGGRFNRGQIGLKGNFIERGVVIGLVGARFERSERMESLFCIVGGGGILSPQLEEIWKRFYGVDKFPTIQDAIDDPKGFQKFVISTRYCTNLG